MRLNPHCTAMTLFLKSIEVAEIFVFLGPNLANSSQWTKCSDPRVRERDVSAKKLEVKQKLKHLECKTLVATIFSAHPQTKMQEKSYWSQKCDFVAQRAFKGQERRQNAPLTVIITGAVRVVKQARKKNLSGQFSRRPRHSRSFRFGHNTYALSGNDSSSNCL